MTSASSTIQSKMMQRYSKAFPAEVIAYTSNRKFDFALLDGQKKLNKFQNEFLYAQLGIELPEPVQIHQVHGNRVIVAEEILHEHDRLIDADGLITRSYDLPLMIRTADCLPVLMYDKKHHGIGIIHVGWKGGQANIVEHAIDLMKKQWQAIPEEISIAFGPSIRSCCYEVGQEFKDFFPDGCISRNGQIFLELPDIALKQLFHCGIDRSNVYDCGICTCCDPNYFSYRREGKKAGRMISLIMLKK